MRRRQFALLFWASMVLAGAANSATAQPIAIASNPQYFSYDGQTIPLVGYSGEYICHISNPDKSSLICTYENYTDFINRLHDAGLNKFRLWVGLNHSPGKMRSPPDNVPLTDEQPFVWNGTRWNLGVFNQTYFDKLKNVVQYAASRPNPIFVEVTLFDPWTGTWATSPWNPANAVQTGNAGGIGFTARKYFATFENGTSDTTASNVNARLRQLELVDKIAAELAGFRNVLYEIANEPDIASSNGVSGTDVARWHEAMVQRLYDKEGSLGISRHIIGVNFHTAEALATVKSTTSANRLAKLVSAHYAGLLDASRFSAIRLVNNYHNGGANELNRAFGFNETKAISLVGNPSSPDGARVEAWEFMLNEGGLIDHFGLNYFEPAAGTVRQYLGVLAGFLRSLPLASMQRKPVASGSWFALSGGQICNTTTQGITCPWMASMVQPNTVTGQRLVFYYHYSLLTNHSFSHYVPNTASRQITVLVSPVAPSGSYRYQWINPKTGAELCAAPPCSPSSFSWLGSGSVSLTSPSFTQDIVLSLTRQ